MYLQLMDQICRRVAAGEWPAGHELPSIRVLAANARVSVITVKRAYLELERQGVILTRQGRGSFVAEGAGVGLRLREEELGEHLRAVAGLSLLLGVSVAEIAGRLQALRDAAGDAGRTSEPDGSEPADEGSEASDGEGRGGPEGGQ